ncbi:MAG: complex I subunit 5 family protein [Lachnospiraceae bacterium]|nr:complex I subunit 5 family protein [Lachnospiraceae bacterium]
MNYVIDIARVCGLGLHFQIDGFRLLYCLIATFMWVMTGLLNPEYMHHYDNKRRYYLYTWVTYLATVGVFLSRDFYTTFIFFEIMSFASYVWVAQDERKESLRAAATYLAVAVIGGLVMLMGIFMLYSITGTLEFDNLRGLYMSGQYVGEASMLRAAGICMLIGFGAKAGAFPLHIWLPKAHPVAPAPASALLSGMLTKTGVFGILVLSAYIFSGFTGWGNIILILGVITMFLGAMLALFSVDLKRTLACSSVSQIGFILTGVGMSGLLGEERTIALAGSVLHMVNHSLIKLVLFMSAGVVFMNLHKLDLNAIRGFGRSKNILKAVFLIGALGIGGIPGFNGYISKTLIHESIVEYTEMLEEGLVAGFFTEGAMKSIEWIFLISGGFTVAYMTKLFICIFIEKNTDPEVQARYDSRKAYMNHRSAAALILSAIVLPVLGLMPGLTMNKFADVSMPFLGGEEFEGIAYFTWTNLKGGLISILMGVVIYLVVVRLLLMKGEKGERVYADRWPKWLDLENLLYRPILLGALPFVFGVFSRILDCLVDTVIVILRKTIFRDSRIVTEREEGIWLTEKAGELVNALNARRKRREEKGTVDYRHVFAMKYVEFNEDSFIVIRSMSFGLLLFCIGLLFTVVYLLMYNAF